MQIVSYIFVDCLLLNKLSLSLKVANTLLGLSNPSSFSVTNGLDDYQNENKLSNSPTKYQNKDIVSIYI